MCDSLTVDVDAKGLDAGDENVNAEVELASADQVRKIHVPWRGLDGVRNVVTSVPSVQCCEHSEYHGLSLSRISLLLDCCLKISHKMFQFSFAHLGVL